MLAEFNLLNMVIEIERVLYSLWKKIWEILGLTSLKLGRLRGNKNMCMCRKYRETQKWELLKNPTKIEEIKKILTEIEPLQLAF